MNLPFGRKRLFVVKFSIYQMDIIEMIKIMPAAIIGLTVHEFAHAYMAFRLG